MTEQRRLLAIGLGTILAEGEVLLIAFAWIGCSDEEPTGTGVTRTEGAVELGLSVDLELVDGVPLVRRLNATADVPVSLAVTWAAGDHVVSVPFADLAAAHEHLLLGWRGGETYTVEVTATDATGNSGTAATTIETDPIPDYFPQGQILAGSGTRLPGHTVLPMHTFANQDVQDLVVVFDEEGQIVYWLPVDDFILDVREWQGGLLALVGSLAGRAVHYAWDGTVLGSWACQDGATVSSVDNVNLPTTFAEHFHHDVTPNPTDPETLVGLARYPIDVVDYPNSYDDPSETIDRVVANDVLVTYDTRTGTVLDELLISDLLPNYRIGYGSLEKTAEQWGDWAHTNALVFDGADYVVSFRHQDVIAKIDPAARALKWLLGNHDNWPPDYQNLLLTPIGDLQWPYHTHAPRVAPDGPNGETVITVFDNGNFQASPWTNQIPATTPRSRVVQFSVDEGAMTVRQDWVFDSPSGGTLFSEAVGDADPLPNGHVLSVWGLLLEQPDGDENASIGLGDRTVRVIELDPSDPADVREVEQLYLSVPRALNVSGWTGYRADRIASVEGRIVD